MSKDFKASDFFSGNCVKDHEGNPVPSDSLNGKVVGLYFSAHWCPPCRAFTPQLAKKYKEIQASGKAFEIIFISSDSDEHAAAEYFSEVKRVFTTVVDHQN